jgi:deoxyadenosine/deoxycytidine kinase
LNERYEKWIETYNAGKMIIVDVNSLKFEEVPEDFGVIINMINAELFGLFK